MDSGDSVAAKGSEMDLGFIIDLQICVINV